MNNVKGRIVDITTGIAYQAEEKAKEVRERAILLAKLLDSSNQLTIIGAGQNKKARFLVGTGAIATVTAGTIAVLGTAGLFVKILFLGGAAALITGFGIGFAEGLKEAKMIHEVVGMRDFGE